MLPSPPLSSIKEKTENILPKVKLLDQVRITLRTKHYSIKTEEAYVSWIKRFILFHNKKHPAEMGKEEIQNFVNHLAVEKHVAHSAREI